MNSFEQMLEFKTDRERLQAYTFQLRPSSGAARARLGGFAVADGHEKALTTRAGASLTIGELFRASALIQLRAPYSVHENCGAVGHGLGPTECNSSKGICQPNDADGYF